MGTMKNTLRVRRAERGDDGVSQREVWKALRMERNRYWGSSSSRVQTLIHPTVRLDAGVLVAVARAR